ncbi:MAG: outer membrane lipoprotein carrier protein LolA [Tepidisphaeraceae bacterium]
MRSLIRAFVALAFSLAPALAQPAPTPTTQASPASQPSGFEQQLETIDRRAGAVQDLTAEFVQEKRSPLLRKPLVSRGSVKAKGALALWETIEPERTIMTFDPKQMRVYYPKQKLVEEYAIQGSLGMMASSPLPRLAAIRQSFRLMPDDGKGLAPGDDRTKGVAVRLEPIDDAVRQLVDHVRVLLDPDRGYMLAFELTDPDGEQTVIRFTKLQANSGLTDQALQPQLPAGVKVSRPLEGAEALP